MPDSPFYYLKDPTGSALAALSTEELRALLLPATVRQLEATGDPRTDTDALKRAINSIPANRFGAVYLAGTFRTLEPIQNGGPDKFPAALIGWPSAGIQYVGPRTDDYALRIAGNAANAALRLANLSIVTGWKCRGLLATGQYYFPDFRGIRIYQPRQVGLDVLGCWASTWSNITIGAARGYAARFCAFNAASLSNFTASLALTLRHRANDAANTGAETNALLEFAQTHGTEAAAEHFGADFLTDWPPDDDTYATNYTGKPWNMTSGFPSMGRGVVMVEGNATNLSNICLESCASGEDPLIRLHTAAAELHLPRFEANVSRVCKIQIHGPETDTHKGIANLITNVHAMDVAQPWHACRSVVRLTGRTSCNRIDGVKASNITDAILAEDAGPHSENELSRVWSYSPKLDRVNHHRQIATP